MATRAPCPCRRVGLIFMVRAVIIRVSDPRQAENLSLATQLRACEEYCRRQGFEVLERFKEQGESAKTADRTELQKLLQYCRTHKGKLQFVVVFNLTRFAREKYDHFALRAHLKSLGISLRSATEPIDDTATGKLMGVLAAFAQFDNDCRSTVHARACGPRWSRALDVPRTIGCLNAPMVTRALLKTMSVPFVRRAFEAFAAGRFTKKEVLARLRLGLHSAWAEGQSQAFGVMLENRLAIGILNVPDYGVHGQRGDFEPLISEELFYRVQGINGRIRIVAPRERNRPTFRCETGQCHACSRRPDSQLVEGPERPPAYHCRPQCPAININKTKLEGLFVELERLQPARPCASSGVSVARMARAQAGSKTTRPTRSGESRRFSRSSTGSTRRYLRRTIDVDACERQRSIARTDLSSDRPTHLSWKELDVEGLRVCGRVLPARRTCGRSVTDQRQRLQRRSFRRESRSTERICSNRRKWSRVQLLDDDQPRKQIW